MSQGNIHEIYLSMLQYAKEGNVVDLANQIQALERISEDNHEEFLHALNIHDAFGRTALHLAATNTDSACLNLLMRKGAWVDMKDSDGNLPIHFASLHSPENLAVLAYSFPISSIFDTQNKQGFTPLHYSVYSANAKNIEVLLELGANTHTLSAWGSTPLSLTESSIESQQAFFLATDKLELKGYKFDNTGNYLITVEKYEESGYGSDVESTGQISLIAEED